MTPLSDRWRGLALLLGNNRQNSLGSRCRLPQRGLLREGDASGHGHMQVQLSENCDPPEGNVPRYGPRMEWLMHMGPGWADSHQNKLTAPLSRLLLLWAG